MAGRIKVVLFNLAMVILLLVLIEALSLLVLSMKGISDAAPALMLTTIAFRHVPITAG
jgi:hypothetical protein